MAYFPAFLDVQERPCVVVGGGRVAEPKVRALVERGARVTVVAPEATPGIVELARTGRIRREGRAYAVGDLAGAFLAIAATSDQAVNRRIASEAREARVLLNVVDVPELCDFIAPAILERGRVQVAVSTSGAAPAFAARIRDRIGEAIGPEFERAADLLAEARARLRRTGASAERRQAVMRRLAESDLPERIRSGDDEGVERLFADLEAGGTRR